MAYIRKRGPYQWQARVNRKGYPPQYQTFETKQEAEDWAAVVESQMIKKIYVDSSKIESTLFSKLIEKYIEDILPQKKSQIPIKGALKSVTAELGRYSLANLTPELICKYRDKRLKIGRSNETVRKELSVIQRIINIAISEWGYKFPEGNPIDDVKFPSPGEARDRRLEANEEKLLLENADSYGGVINHIIGFALQTAMRRSEIANMKWKDVNMESRLIKVLGKNGKTRKVPLSEKAIRILKQLEGENDIYVFGIKPITISKAFNIVCSRAKIEDLHFHDLRHEATSRLFECGKLNMIEIAHITGHLTLQMLKRYTHPRPENIARKIKNF